MSRAGKLSHAHGHGGLTEVEASIDFLNSGDLFMVAGNISLPCTRTLHPHGFELIILIIFVSVSGP